MRSSCSLVSNPRFDSHEEDPAAPAIATNVKVQTQAGARMFEETWQQSYKQDTLWSEAVTFAQAKHQGAPVSRDKVGSRVIS